METKLSKLQSVISMFCSRLLPYDMLLLIGTERENEVQDWISTHLTENSYWMTAISIIEAAELIVDDALVNGNITQ